MSHQSIFHRLTRGALAGAAGVTALNTVTYLDMLTRGRGASDVPARMAEKTLELGGIEMPGDEETRENRLEALGALLGIAVGTGVGVLHSASGVAGRLPFAVESLLVGAAATAASDIPMALTGVSDPKTWGLKGWLSDAIPHAAYGAVVAGVIRKASA